MLTWKKLKTNLSNNQQRFPDYYNAWTNIKKLYTVVAYQVYSAIDYLKDFRNHYRFYQTGKSTTGEYRNFPDSYELTDGASDSNLLRLARSFNIEETTFSRIFFEWENKFTPRTTEEGIERFVKLFFKYELLEKIVDYELAEEISESIQVNVKPWYNNDVTEMDNIYFFEDYNVLGLYLEVYLPSEYGKYLVNMYERIPALINAVGDFKLGKSIVPSSHFQRLEIVWR